MKRQEQTIVNYKHVAVGRLDDLNWFVKEKEHYSYHSSPARACIEAAKCLGSGLPIVADLTAFAERWERELKRFERAIREAFGELPPVPKIDAKAPSAAVVKPEQPVSTPDTPKKRRRLKAA